MHRLRTTNVVRAKLAERTLGYFDQHAVEMRDEPNFWKIIGNYLRTKPSSKLKLSSEITDYDNGLPFR